MGEVKIFYDERRQPRVAELSYTAYFALRREAEALASLNEQRAAVVRELSSLQAGGATARSLAPGRRAVRVLDPGAWAADAPAVIAEGVRAAAEPNVAPVAGVDSARGRALVVPRAVEAYIEAHDEKGGLMDIFRRYYQALGARCGGSLSATFQDRYICLWNYDEWKMFALIDIANGGLRLSLKKEMVPDGRVSEFWVPPKWMGSERMARFSLDDFSIGALDVLVDAYGAA